MTAALLMTVRPAAETSSVMSSSHLPPSQTAGGGGTPPPPPWALHVLAAVDGVDLAGDEGRFRVGEELHDAGDLVGFAEAPDGDLGDDLVEGFLGDGLDHLGGDVAGCDGVDGDALAGGLLGEAHGQAEQAGFGGGVVGLADVAGLADDRADVDDAARSAVEHVLQDRPRQVERARQVDLDDPVPVFDGHLADGLVQGDAGVVDQDVEAAVGVEDFLDDSFAVFGGADVALVGAGAGVGFAEGVGDVFAAGVARGDGDSACGEAFADRQPDTPHTSGHEGYLSGHVCHAVQSFLVLWIAGVRGRRGQRFTCRSRASPWPPPPHRPAAPSPPPRRPSSRARCSATRAPEAPTGCPIEIAPPLTFTFSSEMSRSRIDCNATAANASLISNRSTSAAVLPSRPRAWRIAFAGWDSSEASGPATLPCAPISARIGAPNSSAFALLITTTAAAPSEIWLADPAVTVPSAANAGRNFASDAAVVPSRTPSSSVTVTGSPRRCGTVTVTISSSNNPFLRAVTARSWDWAE